MPFRWSWIDANWKLDALESQSTKQVALTVVANSIPHFAFETALHDRLVRNTCVTWLIMIGIGGDLNLQSWSHLLWCRQAQDVDIPGRTQCSTVPSGSEVFGTVSQAWLLSWTACLVKKIVTLHVTQAWADMIYILKSVIVYLHITIREVLEKSSSILSFFSRVPIGPVVRLARCKAKRIRSEQSGLAVRRHPLPCLVGWGQDLKSTEKPQSRVVFCAACACFGESE